MFVIFIKLFKLLKIFVWFQLTKKFWRERILKVVFLLFQYIIFHMEMGMTLCTNGNFF